MQNEWGFLKKGNFFYAKLLAWTCLIYFPIFFNLGGLCIMFWDEARYGASSFEMLHGKNPFVVTYNFVPAMDSTKPPLLYWLQAISIYLFGFDEFSVRLPSALAGFIICLLLVFFTKKNFNSFSIGAVSSLILLTTEGFTGIDHSIRAADHDAILTLFSFSGVLSFFLYNQDTGRNKYLCFTFIFFGLAILAKGAAGLFFLPGLFIYLIIKKNLFPLLKTKWFYISLGLLVAMLGLVFGIREYYSPGYLKALNEMEILGRHNTTLDSHQGDWLFYINWFKDYNFTYWCYLIPLGWIFGFLNKDKWIHSYSLFSLIVTVSFSILLASAQTKLRWYDLPLYPIVALQAGICIWVPCKFIADFIGRKLNVSSGIIYYIFIVSIFIVPYKNSVANASGRKWDEGFLDYNNIQNYLKLERDAIRNGKLIVNGYAGHYLFYYYKLNEKGFNMQLQYGISDFSPGEKLIIGDDSQKEIEEIYNVEILDQYRYLTVYKIISKKHGPIRSYTS